jgi:hypothetical protein
MAMIMAYMDQTVGDVGRGLAAGGDVLGEAKPVLLVPLLLQGYQRHATTPVR